MKQFRIIVDDAAAWSPYYPSENIITVEDYLQQTEATQNPGYIINLCSGLEYLGTGYYCSLLGEARGEKVIPSVSTINDLHNFDHYRLFDTELEQAVESYLRKLDKTDLDVLDLLIVFGKCAIPELAPFARTLFERYGAPILRVKLTGSPVWKIVTVKFGVLQKLDNAEQSLFGDSLDAFCKSVWRKPRTRRRYRYDLAILHNPQEALPPSNRSAIKKFKRAGAALGLDVDLITPDDFGRLAEYDALFIRETTAVNHHTYRFAKRAENEGLVVIDSPDAILRCSNKVFLNELMDTHNIPRPFTHLLLRGQPVDYEQVEKEAGFPVILKIPDGSFSIGVEKAENRKELEKCIKKMFKRSAIVLLQEFMPTDYDWRIGILNNRPLYACKYHMARGHWQIYNHSAAASTNRTGNADTIGIQHAPREAIKIATRAARLIGDGLFGVDIKSSGQRAVVIEVNDNPSIDSGVEDGYLGDELYRIIMSEFVRRLDHARAGSY
jgi:glutathione synthase/RimK-type ligase-like ATP-grasp enzyme